MSIESRGGRRRRLTETLAVRRRSEYLRYEDEPHPFADRTFFWLNTLGCCPCVKRRRNNPRVDRGMCDIGARARIYRLRNATRELNRLVVMRGEDPSEDAVSLLSGKRLFNNLWL